MLEIRIPKDIAKTPKAMELILINAIHQTGKVGTWFDRYWLGRVLSWFSLEIVSLGGELHFFIRTPDFFKRLLESQIYAQYPTAEVVPMDNDYTELVPQFSKKTKEQWSMWGTEFKFTKDDPYPIKTYIDYGLDKSVKLEEQGSQIDPITPMLEMMGSLKKGEQMWFQILVRAQDAGKVQSKHYPVAGHWFAVEKFDDIKKKAIAEVLKKASKKLETEDEDDAKTNLTKGETNVIAAIERKAGQTLFDVGMRFIYIAEKDAFDPNMIAGLTSVVKQYSSQDMNGFRPQKPTAVDIEMIDDPFGGKTIDKKKGMYNAYRLRSYFYKPYNRDAMVMSAEELATIYHFPNRATSTPSFARIDSKQAEPPQNLPI